MSDVHLLPCPFCGGQATLINDGGLYVQCQVCDAVRGSQFSEDDPSLVIKDWNQRQYLPLSGVEQAARDNAVFDHGYGYGRRHAEQMLQARGLVWSPMDIAPRDGSDLILTDGKSVSFGWFYNGHWVVSGDGLGDEEPTLWMRLPEPPQGACNG